MSKIPLGVSSCLLGHEVRYDGQHKRDLYIMKTLGEFFEWTHVCPEVECGLPIPRESMRLEGDAENPRLRTGKTGIDHTDRLVNWADSRVDQLRKKSLRGFIFKSKSPSSGLYRIKVYAENGHSRPVGRGLWADAFTKAFPLLPVEEEGRLHDSSLRERFLEHVFVYDRWLRHNEEARSLGRLVDFHTRHKLLIMSHDVERYRSLGKLVAAGSSMPLDELYERYIEGLSAALLKQTTAKKHGNVLLHILGYFKKDLDSWEKAEVIELIDRFKAGEHPLIVPISLLNHYVRKYEVEYLAQQWYLHPHPAELKLRSYM
jgi:uncharacterized protein YbgA (DUF1722 family)/uncharacterized protein YbbK (DUF523 family)